MILPRGKIMGRRIDPDTGRAIEFPEADHFMRCEDCGGMIDKRDLAIVIAHDGPLPHPAEDGLQ